MTDDRKNPTASDKLHDPKLDRKLDPNIELLEECRVAPDSKVRLADRDPAADFGLDKKQAKELSEQRVADLALWQNRLYAESKHAVLVVLQGMDASGKDGVVRRVFTGVNPQGVRVTSFKVPTVTERAHDYLWRIHAARPRRGEIGIFNRSHYEDIVTTEVLGLIDAPTRNRRISHVRHFEQMLEDEGTRVIKVFLHVSKDEQRARLQARIDDPEKRWKFNPADLDTRGLWDQYQDRYEHTIAATSTKRCPWYIIPADRKWLRDEVVSRLVLATLLDLAPAVPEPDGVAGLQVV